nr:hypothetical protein [Pandoravirus belohorizontensis]
MSSAGSYRPEVWAYADQRGVPVDPGGPPSSRSSSSNGCNENNSNNGNHATGYVGSETYYDQHTTGYVDECGRPCTVPLTPRVRWSPPQTSAPCDQGQPATPDMALIIERLLDDLDRERAARERAEARTAVTATASSFTTTPATATTTAAAHTLQVGPTGQSTAVLTQQTAQQPPQTQYLLAPPLPPPGFAPAPAVMTATPGGATAPTSAPVGAVATAPGTNGVGAPATTTTPSKAPPGTTSNRTLLLALIPIVVVALLFAAWVVWRFSGIERRLTAMAAHAVSTAPPPLVSPVVSPVVTAPTATPAAVPQRGGMLAVDTNNQYYYARPIAP